MSTTIKNHPVSQLFVHGEHDIYAKSRNGIFYPARSIENRHDDEVKFADSSRKLLSEKNLTWLRFWDVPAERPANNSLIQGTVFTSNEFDGEVTQFVDEGSAHETKRSSSFSLIKRSDGEDDVRLAKPSWPSSRSSTTKEQPHCAHQRVVVHTQPLRMAGPQIPRDATQQRSSVLRLNRKTLAKEILRSNSSSLPSSWKRSMNTDVHPTLSNQSMAKYMKNERSNFDFGDRSLMRNDTQIFERYADRDATEMLLHERHYESEDEFDARGAIMKSHVIQSAHSSVRYPGGPYQSLDWYETPNINQSASTPPTHSSNFTLSLSPGRLQDANSLKLTQARFTSQLSHVGHQPESPRRIPDENLIWMKRLKDNAKKCRKMYGIINRHLWCTQCKWKKACTRFKE